MPHRLFALLVCVMLLGSCSRRADLGGEALAAEGCTSSCGAMDAATMPPVDPGIERPDSLFPGEPADPEAVDAFLRSLDGLWHGISTEVGVADDEVGPRFEITLAPGALPAAGVFNLQCPDAQRCDLFGTRGFTVTRGTFEIINLSAGAVASASGYFVGEQPSGRRFESPFWALKREERKYGPVVTFDLGQPNAGPAVSVSRRVVLAPGPWPDAGGALLDAGRLADAGSVEGGTREGSAADASRSDARVPDASPSDGGGT